MSIRSARPFAAAMFGLALTGCVEPVRPTSRAFAAPALAGRWMSMPSELGSHGWHQDELVLRADGGFATISRSYGLYHGQRRNDLSISTRVEGRYRVDRDRLYFEAARRVWWDHFEDPGAGEQREEPYPWASLFDDATYAVSEGVLTLRYNVYPADAPVPVTVEYVQVR